MRISAYANTPSPRLSGAPSSCLLFSPEVCMFRVLPPHHLGVCKYAISASVAARLAYLALFLRQVAKNAKCKVQNAKLGTAAFNASPFGGGGGEADGEGERVGGASPSPTDGIGDSRGRPPGRPVSGGLWRRTAGDCRGRPPGRPASDGLWRRTVGDCRGRPPGRPVSGNVYGYNSVLLYASFFLLMRIMTSMASSLSCRSERMPMPDSFTSRMARSIEL